MLFTKESYIYSCQFDSMLSSFSPASQDIQEHHCANILQAQKLRRCSPCRRETQAVTGFYVFLFRKDLARPCKTFNNDRSGGAGSALDQDEAAFASGL